MKGLSQLGQSKKIVGESTITATLVHLTATKLGQATWIVKML